MKIKSLLVATATLIVAIHGYSQGIVQFQNGTTTRVIDGQTGANAAAGSLTIGLYYSADLGAAVDTQAATDALTLLSTTGLSPLGFLAGVYNGGAVELPSTAAGTMGLVQVRAWDSAFDSYATAFAANSWVGASDALVVTAGGGTLPPTDLVAAGLSGFATSQVPEPSTIAFGILGGIGAMVLLRRRK